MHRLQKLYNFQKAVELNSRNFVQKRNRERNIEWQDVQRGVDSHIPILEKEIIEG